MVIGGKIVPMESCKRAYRTNTSEWIWVAYDNTRARLPIAIAPTAEILAEIMGVSKISVETNWSKYRHGKLSTAKYAKVYIGDSEDE